MSATAVRGVLTHRDGVTRQSFSVAATAEGRQSLTAVMGAVRQLSAEVSSALTGLMEAEKHTHTHHDEEEEGDDEEDSDEDEATAPPPEPPPKRSKTSSCN